LKNSVVNSETPEWSSVLDHMDQFNGMPVCPANGVYSLGNTVANSPRCSHPGHAISKGSKELVGAWEGVEVGRESAGNNTVTITADTIHFHGADSREWYKAKYLIPAGKTPKQLIAKIIDCPAPDFIGKTSFAIFKVENGTLTLVGHPPGAPDAPKSFKGDATSRTFVFKKKPINPIVRHKRI
jgi:hypothetical protein